MAIAGQNISVAKSILQKGGLVGIPTETVYGLAANGFSREAVLKIFEAKNRPLFDPLILHAGSIEKIHAFVKEFPEPALKLAEKFWPGPLTLLLPRKEIVPDIACSGLPDVAVRIPDHPLTLELLSQLDFPLAAPSANPFGYVSPTSPFHVLRQLGGKIDYILDGGECRVGIESTIVGFEGNKAIIYRIGGLATEEIEDVTGRVEIRVNISSDPKAPGQLKSHYAPKKEFRLGKDFPLRAEDLRIEEAKGKKIGVISFYNDYAPHKTMRLSEKKDLREAAHNLFRAMRELDESDVDVIIAEIFPEEFIGRAINDRLRRAAAK